jgi:hypothetical protein
MEKQVMDKFYKDFLAKDVLMKVKHSGERYDIVLYDLQNRTFAGISAYFSDVVEYLERKLSLNRA